MSRVAVGTVASTSHLSAARLLAESLHRVHPDVPFHVAVVGDIPDRHRNALVGWHLHPLEALPLPDRQAMLFRYGRGAFMMSLKPSLVRLLLDRGHDAVLYLDADIQVLGDLSPVLRTVGSHALTLSPHLLGVRHDPARQAVERDLVRLGTYNAGVFGVRRCPEAYAFLGWWEARLRTHCRVAVEGGIHLDQRWLDLAPGFVADTHVLRDPGVNVAYWNLPDRTIDRSGGGWRVDGVPLRLLHLSGFDASDPEQLSRFCAGRPVATVGALARVCREYAASLVAAGYLEDQLLPWPGDTWSDGRPIPDEARRAFAALHDAGVDCGDPFDVTRRDGFHAWWMHPMRRLRRRIRPVAGWVRSVWAGR